MYLKFFLLALGFLFVGCVAKIPPIQYYDLEAKMDLEKSVVAKNLAWEISVNPKISGTKIAYREDSNKIAYFARNAWVEPFPALLNTIAQKMTKQIGLNPNAKPLKINILDCYYTENAQKVTLKAIVQYGDSSVLLIEEQAVENGGFEKIIQAYEAVINKAFVKIFARF